MDVFYQTRSSKAVKSQLVLRNPSDASLEEYEFLRRSPTYLTLVLLIRPSLS